MRSELGYVLPIGPRAGAATSWADDVDRALEHLGSHVTGLWMTDHLFWGADPTYEAWTVLAFVAARWPDYDVGPIVLGQGYRNPALTAKMAATLHDLSGGRFVLGIGAGWKQDEYDAYGYDFPGPATRVDELHDALTIITKLWDEPGPVSWSGQHYGVVDAHAEPRPSPRPRIMVGGGGRRTTGLAARFADWWSLPDTDPGGYADRLAVVRQHCEDIGRDPSTLRSTWFGRIAVADDEQAAERLSDGEWTNERAIVGTPTQVLDRVRAFEALGVDSFMVDVLGLDEPRTHELFVNLVRPHFAARSSTD